MENKKTTELLDLLTKLVDSEGHLKKGYDECLAELKSREPFYSLFHPVSDREVLEEFEDIKDDIKRLNRHKHDERTGDVMIRI